MIRSCWYQPQWSSVIETRKSPAAPTRSRRGSVDADQLLATTLKRRADVGGQRLGDRREHGEGGEREEPRQVEVEPVRQHDLEAEQQRGGERGELERRLAARDEVDGDRSEQERDLEHALQQVQVGQARVVLPPVPERERRLAVDLPGDRPLPELVRGAQRVPVERQDREGGEARGEERGGEDERRAQPSFRIRRPERRQQQRRELRPARERAERTARDRRADEPEAPDQKQRRERVVRVR